MAAASASTRANLVWLGYVMVAASASFAAANGVFASLVIHAGVDPAALAATRIYGAGAILVFFLLPHVRSLRRAHLLPLALFGVVGLVLGQGAYFQAISHADVALVLVIIFTAPIVVAVYERIRLSATLPLYAWAGIVVAVGGVALAIVGEGGMPAISFAGFLFALVAMIAYAWSVILAAGLPTALPPLVVPGGTSLLASGGNYTPNVLDATPDGSGSAHPTQPAAVHVRARDKKTYRWILAECRMDGS